MPEAQYTISGFNIAGLDPIEVSKPVTGTTLTLTDSDIGKMNVFTGSANTSVTLPSASGTLDGYSKAGRMIGLRGPSTLTASVTLSPASGQFMRGAGALPNGTAINSRVIQDNHILILISDGTNWVVYHQFWPISTGLISVHRTADVSLAAGSNGIIYNTVAEGNQDGWFNTSTGIYSPTLPGYYEFNVSTFVWASSGATTFVAYMRKNGADTKAVGRLSLSSGETASFAGTLRLYANGATDSFQPSIVTSPLTATLGGASSESYLQARYTGP